MYEDPLSGGACTRARSWTGCLFAEHILHSLPFFLCEGVCVWPLSEFALDQKGAVPAQMAVIMWSTSHDCDHFPIEHSS